MVVFVPEKLKEIVDNWIYNSNRKTEHGGVFFGSETEFKSFLPLPNFSENPSRSFDKGNSRYFLEEFAKLIVMKPIAGMHTHPTGTVPSENDLEYVKHFGYPFEVVVADMGDELRWFCVNKELRHVPLYFKDIEMEKLFLLLTQALGLIDLGRVFITPKSELLCENEKGRFFINLDRDAFMVWNWLNNHDRYYRTKKKMQEDLKISLNRINNALDRLNVEI